MIMTKTHTQLSFIRMFQHFIQFQHFTNKTTNELTASLILKDMKELDGLKLD
eukprot:m.49832 g.49832  ORF g.49832 m.49832 type:complete len:52 (-) comp10873_c0_seq15:4092-4247(-)